MLLSLLKILFFFAVVLALALGAVQLSETGQVLRIEYGGIEYALSPLKALVALFVLMIAAWLIFKLLGLGTGRPAVPGGRRDRHSTAISPARASRKGYAAFGEGMLAVASGEGKLAQDKAAKAAKYLNQPHLTNLLAAQAAETSGDTGKAIGIYRTLLDDDRTRFVGIRGLMRQKLAEGDTTRRCCWRRRPMREAAPQGGSGHPAGPADPGTGLERCPPDPEGQAHAGRPAQGRGAAPRCRPGPAGG